MLTKEQFSAALRLPLTLFIEVEVLQALVQVARGGSSPDVGVGVD